MAIYQYYLAVIPKNGIEKRHDVTPTKIRVSSETGYFESDAELYWKGIKVNLEDIISKIDFLIERANYGNTENSYNWKINTGNADNDAYLYLDKKSLTIKEFSFRADLREKDLKFLKNMIALGKENNWMFMDRKGKLMKPDINEIRVSILDSDAFCFLKDPIKYIESLE